jgi:hypothetical protein
MPPFGGLHSVRAASPPGAPTRRERVRAELSLVLAAGRLEPSIDPHRLWRLRPHCHGSCNKLHLPRPKGCGSSRTRHAGGDASVDKIQRQIESRKLQADYLKHLTTLSTGSIVIISTFMEKLFRAPSWKLLVAMSLGGFTLCILGSLFLHYHSIVEVQEGEFENSHWTLVLV